MKMVAPQEVQHVLSRHILADGYDIIFDYKNSHGSYLVDARDGRAYLDFFSMFGSMAVGYNHPHLVAHKELFADIAINKTSNSDVYTTIYAQMVQTFGRVGIPEYLPHAFFVDGGALAVENALKTAFDWKVRKNLDKGISGRGHKVLHFKQSFHGRSGYTLSLTNTADPRKYMYFPQFEWPRIHNPVIKFPLHEEHLTTVMGEEHRSLSEIDSALAQHKDDIAALIIEPIQAEGGDNHFRGIFFQELQDRAHQHDFLFICDEVQTGVALTGKFWAHEHFDIQPDIIAFGKKTQICGILAGPRIDEVSKNVFREASRINSTFGGNLVDMLRWTLILEIIEKEHLVQNAALMGDYFLSHLHQLSEQFQAISNVRGRGLMCAFDLPNSDIRNKFVKDCKIQGLLVLACGEHSIRFRPHLVVCREEIDLGVSIMESVCKEGL